MLYKIKMTSGHTIQLRGVRKFEYDAKSSRFTAVLPGWSKYVGNGVEHISIEDDPEWWGATAEIIDPKTASAAVSFDSEKVNPKDIKMDGENGRSEFGYAGGVMSQDHNGSGAAGEGFLNFNCREYCVPRELVETTFAPVETLPKNPAEAIPLDRFLRNFH